MLFEMLGHKHFWIILFWLFQRYVSPNNQLLGISRSQSTELQVFVDVINRI